MTAFKKARQNCFPFFLLGLAVLASSCMPSSPKARLGLNAGNQAPTTGTNTTPNEVLVGFSGETRNFIDKAGVRSFATTDVSSDDQAPFVIWGQQVQTKVQSLQSTQRVCVLAEFRDTSPSRILVVSAVRRRVIISTKQTSTGPVSTVSYSWLVYPNDVLRNQADCLTNGVLGAKNTIYGLAPQMFYSLSSICANCTNSPLSEGMRVVFDSGASVEDVNILGLKIRILLQSVSDPVGAQCTSNSVCAQIGFSCCLEGQCVRDGAVKAGVDTTGAEYLSALQDVANNPTRFKVYPQFFYVCPTEIPTVPGDPDATDPAFEALKRFNEMRDLFHCLNPQNSDDISYCAIKYPAASIRIKSQNPADGIFTVRNDDNNFRWANPALPSNSIHELRYGEQVIFNETLAGLNLTQITGSHSINPVDISDMVTAETVQVTKQLPSNAKDDTLIIKYKVDGTCEKLSSTLARCKKTYIQNQTSTPRRSTDHFGNIFQLPDYASMDPSDPSFLPPIVKLGDTIIPEGSSWVIDGGDIRFTPTPTTNQKVEIIYYVNKTSTFIDTLTQSRSLSQQRVNELCGCGVIGVTNCNLTPVITNGAVSDYSCVYPQPQTPEPPLQQVVFVSGKNVPHRYYDINGTVWDGDSYTTAPAQEGKLFEYTSNDVNKPNNTTNYIGFNEIYGSFAKQSTSARPPRMVNVKRDRTYDIFVDSGGFSSCDNCGNDPYTPLQRLFPQSFSTKGGGYVPDRFASNRMNATGLYRADDLIFGRACFVPATMIPWTHAEDTTGSVSVQRRRRLAAQHFMFANGYQRDWYGFDYGSLIGSFDGVKWFSIGNQRRIKSSSSKLFIAVNAYFGDRSIDNTFKVVVTEAASSANSGSFVEHDTNSDGAECQRSHYCSNDDDCIAQLGYDYTCQNVTSLTTKWPLFDGSGNEIVGSDSRILVSLLNGTNGQQKRCVYRGKGATCSPNLSAPLSALNGTNDFGFHACSPNQYCQILSGADRFNTAIARFASSPLSQNLLITPAVTRDTVGLGARLIGRPLNFYGTDAITKITATEWSLNNDITFRDHMINRVGSQAICVPGKDIAGSTTFADAQSRTPPLTDKEAADRVFGVGPAAKMINLATTNPKLVSMCPATVNGTYTHLSPTASIIDPSVFTDAAIRENISSTMLNMTEYASLNLFSSRGPTSSVTGNSAITNIGIQQNACMRTPGSPCLSDMECAPNQWMATKMRSLPNWGGFTNNPAERAYWTEELTCGNPEPKELFNNFANTAFDLKANRCCRDTGKAMKIFTQQDGASNFLNCVGSNTELAIAGLNIPLNSANRNPRNNVIFDVATCEETPSSGKLPALMSPTSRAGAPFMRLDRLARQYDTLDQMNSRMCCTQNWVRSFHSTNGGGYKWGSGRSQNIKKSVLGGWNWYRDTKFTGGTLVELQASEDQEKLACSALNWGTLACEVRDLNDEQGQNYLRWIANFELVGIPQVMIPLPTELTEKLTNETGAPFVRQTSDLEGTRTPLTDTLTSSVPDVTLNPALPTNGYISANNSAKLAIASGKLKRVFSEDEFNCCVPAGGKVPKSANQNSCCTGTLTDVSGEPRCCLGDFADVSVYLNRYVSSEGRGLPASAYDPHTGYIKDPGQVFAIANAKQLCCSGNIVQGSALARLHIPLQGGDILPEAMTRRFVYREDGVDNNDQTQSIGARYDLGFRWNNHFYCAPADYTAPVGN